MEDILEQEVAIVTGAASGIGRAIAERFANEGALVVIADIDDSGKEVAQKISEKGGAALFLQTDISEPDDVESLIEFTVEEFGGIDILVNNAGGAFSDDTLHRISEDIWDDNIDVNLKGSFLCSQKALPYLSKSEGNIVHISSVNAISGFGLPAYSAAKGGIISMSRVIAVQYGIHGIRSNVIIPGTINTQAHQAYMEEEGQEVSEQWIDQYPLGRFGKPEEIADAALFLGSHLSSFVTGTELVVDGGCSAGPDLTFEKLSYDIEEVPDSF